MRITFRKDKVEPFSARTYTVSVDGIAVGKLQQKAPGGKWYYYVGEIVNGVTIPHINTYCDPQLLEKVKLSCKAYIQSAMKNAKRDEQAS